MPGPLVARSSSLFASGEIFINLPPGTYHTSDDNSDDEVLALEEAPEHLRRNTNKDAPIIVDSSSDEEGDIPNQAVGIHNKRHIGDVFDITAPAVWPRESRPSPKRRRKSTTIPPSQKTPVFIQPNLPSSSSPDTAGPSTPESFLAEDYLTHVLDILPDIDSEWALRHITEEMIIRKNDNPANRVVEIALEMEEGYPKFVVSAKGKEKERTTIIPGAAEEYRSSAYKSEERTGEAYYDNSINQLETDFPYTPAPHIRSTYHTMERHYVPSFFRLLEHSQRNPKPYMELKRSRNAGKGKNKAKDLADVEVIDEKVVDNGALAFRTELNWLRNTLAKEAEKEDAAEARRLATEEALASGGGIECGCCFGDTLLEEMIQCTEGHLFCRECTTQHAETKLGEQSAVILCMDQSACTSAFPESELTRLLSAKSLQLYHQLKQAKDLEQAEIEGLESCPNCPFAAVIDNPDEKLFRCMNEDCGQVTCRACKRKDHIPKTCAEVEADLKLNNRHTVEDAMSEALIRKCPKCAKPYIKESGCNKILCHKCGTLSCYICQKAIIGYDHFDQNPVVPGRARQSNKCLLWDSQEKQHDEEAVRAARDVAAARVLAAAQENGVELNAEDINVALPDPQGAVGGIGMIRQLPPGGDMIRQMDEDVQRMRAAMHARMDALRQIPIPIPIRNQLVNGVGQNQVPARVPLPPLPRLPLPFLAGAPYQLHQFNYNPNLGMMGNPPPHINQIPDIPAGMRYNGLRPLILPNRLNVPGPVNLEPLADQDLGLDDDDEDDDYDDDDDSSEEDDDEENIGLEYRDEEVRAANEVEAQLRVPPPPKVNNRRVRRNVVENPVVGMVLRPVAPATPVAQRRGRRRR